MKPNTIGLMAGLASAILAATIPAESQPPAKMARIGIISGADHPTWEAFRQGLKELGHVEGRTVHLEYRWHAGRTERSPDLAAELVRLNVDVIVVSTATPAAAVKAATSTIPVVFVAVADPVGLGLVASLARPGGNITGFATVVPDGFTAKQLELLREMVPHLSRVAVLMNPTNAMHRLQVAQSVAAADTLKLKLHVVEVRAPGELERAFEVATRERAEAIHVYGDPVTFVHRARIAELAAKHRLPAMYLFKDHPEAGGLMSYGPSLPDLFRLASTYVDKILRGAKPADLPVQQPTRFDLVVNLRTAKALGLAVPESILIRTDQVIQ